MMNRCWTLSVVMCLAVPGALEAQGLAFGGRAGTLGLGGEVALGLTPRVVVRGGIGLSPYEPGVSFDDIDVSMKLPTVWNVGVDVYLNDVVRLGGGFLFRSGDPEVSGTFDAAQDIGGMSFTPGEIGTLTGVIASRGRAPYVLIGFGRHTAPGVGLFLDVGVAFLGDPTVSLGAEGGSLSAGADPLMSALQQEAADFEANTSRYLKLWPIISLGFRLGAQ